LLPLLKNKTSGFAEIWTVPRSTHRSADTTICGVEQLKLQSFMNDCWICGCIAYAWLVGTEIDIAIT
jgi:hypothetical protein